MLKTRVKLFEAGTLVELEEDINGFLEGHPDNVTEEIEVRSTESGYFASVVYYVEVPRG